jgi:Uma2 family endonuclease
MDSLYPLAPHQSLLTMYDLPSEDPEEPGLPDEFHNFQPQLLRETCRSSMYPPERMFMGTDLNLYYDGKHPQWHKRPDWFLVLGVEPANQQADLRWSYVIWQEGVAPFLVVELLSPGTEAEDLGQTLREVNQPPTKWQVYEQILRVPYYVLFDRYQNQFRAFEMVGTRYQELQLTDQRFWFEELKLGLGVWSGRYQGAEGLWLRWWGKDGDWVLTTAEQLEQERLRAERLAAQLRALGIEPDQNS